MRIKFKETEIASHITDTSRINFTTHDFNFGEIYLKLSLVTIPY
jgi:hypothetical protein